MIDELQWDSRASEWLPQETDHEYIRSLMQQVTAPGEFASWIAPPRIGINNQALDFPYVRM